MCNGIRQIKNLLKERILSRTDVDHRQNDILFNAERIIISLFFLFSILCGGKRSEGGGSF